MKKIIKKNSNCQLGFDANTFALTELIVNNTNYIASSDSLFTISILDKHGNQNILKSTDFDNITLITENKISFTNRLGISIICHIRNDHEFFYFKFDIKKNNNDITLEWFDGPQVIIDEQLFSAYDGSGLLFWPISEGMLIDDPRIREVKENGFFKYTPLKFPVTGSNGYYPGNAQMQYLAFYDKNGGFYFAAHDLEHITKAVEFEALPSKKVRLSLQTFLGNSDADYLPFEYVLGGKVNDWQDAAEIYRNFVYEDKNMPKKLNCREDLPKWFDESVVSLIYPVRGDGDDKGDMKSNEYFPYQNALPTIKYYNDVFKSKIMALLMHWEGTAPWAPPYVWPPFGGVDMLAEFRDQLHYDGNLLGVYCSGTAWTQQSSIIEYSQEAKFQAENLEKYMARGPKGEIDAFICNGTKNNGQRLGYDCCIGEEWTKKLVISEIEKLADFGIDYAQYFDQNMGGGAALCYSPKHSHANVPGSWQTVAMNDIAARSYELIKKKKQSMLLGCEAASAGAYIKNFVFNDLRYSNAYWYAGKTVPAYSYVFHEYINNFMGNQNGINRTIDFDFSDDNLLFRTAYAFNSGDMLSVVLKDNSKIHWCWVLKWSEPEPEQTPIITLVKNLNMWRKNNFGKSFLTYGKMIKPIVDINTEKYELLSKISGKKILFDGVLSSSWENNTGKKRMFATNFRNKKIPVSFSLNVNISKLGGSKIKVNANTTFIMDELTSYIIDCDKI